MNGKNNTSSTANASKLGVELRSRREEINYNESDSPPLSPRELSSQEGDGGIWGTKTSPNVAVVPEWAKMFKAEITLQQEETNKSIQDAVKSINESINDVVKEMEKNLKKELDDKISALEKKLSEKYEERIQKMETHFNHRLEKQKQEHDVLATQLQECIRANTDLQNNNAKLCNELQFVKNEIIMQKKTESEKLSWNLLLSGPKVPSISQQENLLQITTDLIKDNTHHHLKVAEIASVERYGRLPKTNMQDKRGILVKFHSKETKFQIMRARKKGSGLFINEQLTREINDLFYKVRTLKKNNKNNLGILYTYNGIIKARKTAVGKTYDIFTEDDLMKVKSAFGIVDIECSAAARGNSSV